MDGATCVNRGLAAAAAKDLGGRQVSEGERDKEKDDAWVPCASDWREDVCLWANRAIQNIGYLQASS